jgi:hypothetical protein
MQFDMWYLCRQLEGYVSTVATAGLGMCRQLEGYVSTVATAGLGMSDPNTIQHFTAHHMLQHYTTPHLTVLNGSYDDL